MDVLASHVYRFSKLIASQAIVLAPQELSDLWCSSTQPQISRQAKAVTLLHSPPLPLVPDPLTPQSESAAVGPVIAPGSASIFSLSASSSNCSLLQVPFALRHIQLSLTLSQRQKPSQEASRSPSVTSLPLLPQ